MRYKKLDSSVVRLESGEEIVSCLIKLCSELGITTDVVPDIDALSEAELANYNPSNRE